MVTMESAAEARRAVNKPLCQCPIHPASPSTMRQGGMAGSTRTATARAWRRDIRIMDMETGAEQEMAMDTRGPAPGQAMRIVRIRCRGQ